MSLFFKQFRTLVWKNILLKMRNPIGLLIEFCIPIAVMIGLWGIRLALKPKVIDESIPDSFRYSQTLTDIYKYPACGTDTLFWRCVDSTSDVCEIGNSRCQLKHIAIAPRDAGDADQIQAAMEYMAFVNASIDAYQVEPLFVFFDSEDAFVDFLMSSDYSVDTEMYTYSAGIIFNQGYPHWDYTVRLNKTQALAEEQTQANPQTNVKAVDDSIKTNDESPEDPQGNFLSPYVQAYLDTGIYAIQDSINSFVATKTCRLTNSCDTDQNVIMRALGYVDFPNPEELTSVFWALIGAYFALLMILALLYPIANVIRSLVAEKESRMREGMLMMALRADVLWASWIFHFLLIFVPMSVLLMLVGTLVFVYSELKYIFLYFFAFFVASLAYAILMSVLFSKAKTAAIVGTIVFFMGYFIYVGLQSANPSRSQLLFACLHPASAFTFGTLAFTEYEDSKVGLNDDNWTRSSDYVISFRDTIAMQFVNMAYLLVLAWYFAQVWPSEYGTSKPWYFLFKSDYWLNSLSPILNLLPIQLHSRLRTSSHAEIEMEAIANSDTPIEGITEDLKDQIENSRCVDIRNLRKEFLTNSGKKVAVDGLSLQMFTGQITALLGHNGAGKTTTLSMLTGLIPPDSGTAYINGINIRENLDEARQCLGVCPQHDVLLDDLTVEEHLQFFASIKGTPPEEIQAEVDKYIEAVALSEKSKDYVKNLSGGQKRKLSVAIAFIGNSKVVILDEPTSGMDPYSRRFTWNVIRQHRENRIIILTTHFMDEADLLGDRIAIMGDGRLCCCGTSLFLKKMYGVGYNMTIEKASSTLFDEGGVLKIIHAQIPDAKLLTNVGTELTVQLPLTSSNQFVPLFQKLDDNLESLKIQSYGMSVTTLEEVFLKVASGSHDYMATTNEKDARNQSSTAATKTQNKRKVSDEHIANASEVVTFNQQGDNNEVLGNDASVNKQDVESRKVIVDVHKIPEEYQFNLFLQQMKALIKKRYIIFSRDTKAWIYQFLLPVIFLLAGVAIMYVAVFSVKQPELILTIDDYNTHISTDVLPLPFSAANMYCFNTSCFSISGQEELMSHAANADNLPLEPGTGFYSIYNVSEYLFENRNHQHAASRYGAYTFSNIQTNNLDGNLSYAEYFVHANYTGVHAGPVFSSFIGDVVVKYFNADASITSRLHPMPDTKLQDKLFRNFNLTNLVFFILLAIPFIPASFGGYVVYEKETRTKQQQIVSGVSLPAYWLSNWVWDFCTYQITAWLIIIIIVSFPDTDKLSKGEALGATIVLFQLYGLSVSGFSYLMAFLMKKASTAQITILFSIFILGLILTIVGVVLRQIPSVKDAYMNYIRYFFCIFPPFALGDALTSLAVIDYWGFADARTYTPFDWNIAGMPIMMMAIESIAYVFITILIDYLMGDRYVQQLFSGDPVFPVDNTVKDEDVLAEEKRARSDDALAHSTILMREVKKLYNTNKFAVKGISLGIPNGECFGLLGTNGAGKTSLLSMLVGNIFPSAGSIFLNGLNFAENTYSCRRHIGFCPQFDALFELMTAREHVTFYAEIKGIKPSCMENEVNAKIAEMGLTQYADRTAGGYSGGNKRKLSVAIAMVGEPSLVFLDEPSTGMDPMARRFMWDVIVDIVTKRETCSLILTTHSMEECEALCSRIGIMVSGVLRCLGSSQRLRDRYGLGYQMEVLLEFPEPSEIANVSNEILAAGAFNSDVTAVNDASLKAILENLGKGAWYERITPVESGADIRAALEVSKAVTVKHLASWIILETRAEAYFQFLENNFQGYQLRERQGAKIRIEVPFIMADGTRRKLSYMFGQMEASKKALSVREYSIAQTSLEQIFNSFASHYDGQENAGATHINSH